MCAVRVLILTGVRPLSLAAFALSQRGHCTTMSLGRVSALLAAIFVIVSAYIVVMPLTGLLPEATDHAAQIDFLFKFMLVGSVAVFLIVEGLLLYFVLRYRRRPEDPEDALGANIHGNTRLEIIWSVIPALFLVVLSIMSFVVYADIVATPKHAYIMNAHAYQFGWTCEHPAYKLPQAPYMVEEASTCHMPVDQEVTVNLRATDVIHSFWVPEFRVKQDAVPGYPTRMHFKTTRVGEYRLICAEFCGTGHSEMYAKLFVCPTTKAEAAQSDVCGHLTFDEWARQQQQQQTGGGSLNNLSYKKDIFPIFTAHCASCHMNGNAFGGLNLSTYQGMVKGGVIVPGSVLGKNHATSTIWKITQPSGPWPGGNRMPLGGPYLSSLEEQKLAAWLDQGAKDN